MPVKLQHPEYCWIGLVGPGNEQNELIEYQGTRYPSAWKGPHRNFAQQQMSPEIIHPKVVDSVGSDTGPKLYPNTGRPQVGNDFN